MYVRCRARAARAQKIYLLRETARFDLQSVRNTRRASACVARDLPWKLRSLSADLLGAMLLLPSAPGGLTRAIASAAAVHVRSDRGACRGSPVGFASEIR